jgi:hypothetical protein
VSSAVAVNPVVSLTNSNIDFNPSHKFLQVRSRRSQQYEPLLLENEREAVADLLQYLESMYSIYTMPTSTHMSRPHNHQLFPRLTAHRINYPLFF